MGSLRRFATSYVCSSSRYTMDKRIKELLFGPYAGFTTKFLKSGSLLDLFRSIKFSNIKAMIFAGIHNLPLTKYLIEQVSLYSCRTVLSALKEYYPAAIKEDWETVVAGYRVQVIKERRSRKVEYWNLGQK